MSSRGQVAKYEFDAFLGDADVERVRALQGRFNIFAAVGLDRQEIRHSCFLATLLDPHETHGLGDRFLREFLAQACSVSGSAAFTLSDVLLAEWDDTRVLREWEHLDVLLESRAAGFVCAIENKIACVEHGDQLRRYREALDCEFPSDHYPHRLLLLLSPDGLKPTDPTYHVLTYQHVVRAVDSVLERSSGIDADVLVVIRHYADLLRSRVVQHEELVSLCRRIFQRHRRVIEAINEFGNADVHQVIADHVGKLIERDGAAFDLTFDSGRVGIIRFADVTLDSNSWMRKADWTKSGRMVLFEFTNNDKDGLWLELVLGRGPEAIRAKILKGCVGSPFLNTKRVVQWHRLWNEQILKPQLLRRAAAHEVSVESVLEQVDEYWARFKARILPELRAKLQRMD